MRLTLGAKVNYPSQGPCLIGPVIEKVVDGRSVKFYQLAILDEGGGKVFVPVAGVKTIGLRLLLKRDEIPGLLARLKESITPVRDWKERARDNTRRLSSGSAFDLVEVVGSLTELRETKELSVRERWMLDKARRLLVTEISEVLKETRRAADDQVGEALKGPWVPRVSRDA